MKDILFGIVLMISSGAMYWASLTLPKSKWEPLGSGSFPRVLFISLFFLAAIMIVQKWVETRKLARMDKLDLGAWFQKKRVILYCFLLLFLYIFLLKYIGFIIATIVFLFIFQWMLDRKHPSYLKISIISVGYTLPVYYFFGHYLRVYLP